MKMWTILLVAVTVLCIILRSPMAYALWYILIAVRVLAIWLPNHYLSKLAITRKITDDRLFVGESATLSLEMTNESRLPLPWLQIRQNLPYSLSDSSNVSYAMTISPSSTNSLTLKLTAKNRGFHRLGSLFWTIADPLGMADIAGEMRMNDYMIVYPKVYQLDGWPLIANIFLGDTRAREVWYEDYARVIGMRDYARGDSIRRINWKATARTGDLKVKEFDPTVTSIYQIILNLDDNDYHYDSTTGSDPELAIELAASLAVKLDQQQSQIGLSANCQDAVVEFNKELGHRELMSVTSFSIPPTKRGGIVPIVEALARAKVTTEVKQYTELALESIAAAPRGANTLLITPRPGESLRQVAMRSRLCGHRTSIFLVGKPKQQHLDFLSMDGVDIYWVEKVGRGEALAIKPIASLKQMVGGRLA